MARLRVEQLARRCGVSVDTVRYYQTRGLLAAPERDGRVVYYGPEHIERIRRIRALQRRGLTLAAVRRVLDGRLDDTRRGGTGRRADADADLAAAVAGARDDVSEDLLTLDELAERSGVPAEILAAVEREGIRLGRHIDGRDRYSSADVEMVRFGITLLEAGFPLTDLLALARRHHEAVRDLAEQAVELFDRHVRTPARSGGDEAEAAERIVATFGTLLPAATALVAHHFRRVLLAAAEERLAEARGGGDLAVAAAAKSRGRR